MPVYEYQCRDCDQIFEIDQRIVDPPLDHCPQCGGSIERLISRCSFVLKGNGWYVTEHPSADRKKSLEKENKKGTETASSKPQGTETTSSKPADIPISKPAHTSAPAAPST